MPTFLRPWLMMLLLAALGVGCESRAGEAGREGEEDLAFDSVAWQDSVRAFSSEAVRGRMADDLLRRDRRVGRTRREVVRMLGEPERTPYFREWDLVYWLGPERGLVGIDSEWLVLRLDEAQRVVEARILTD